MKISTEARPIKRRLNERRSGRPEGRKAENNALKTNVAMNLRPDNDIIYMALDISTVSTGYAIMDAGGRLLNYGVIRAAGSIPERLKIMRDDIIIILNKYKPTICAIEDMISFKFGHVAKLLNYFNGVAYLCCYDYNGNDIIFITSSAMKASIGVNPRALKKAGYDRAGIKEIVYNKICEIYHIKIFEDDPDYKYRHDIADAILCAHKLLINLKGTKCNT